MDDVLHLHQTTDCAVWEEAFMKTFPNCGIPEGTMIGWFANAMMAKADSLAALTPASDGRAEAELAKLADPVAVHANMLRGTIAKPSWAQIKHLYAGEADKAEALLAEAHAAGLREAAEIVRRFISDHPISPGKIYWDVACDAIIARAAEGGSHE